MFKQILLLVYQIYLSKDGQRKKQIELYLGFNGHVALSPDDLRNELCVYQELFSEEYRLYLENLYLNLMSKMNGMPFEQCLDVLDSLIFIQEISAVALWKYHLNVGDVIENFVRDFDRLDVPEERIRLYSSAQNC